MDKTELISVISRSSNKYGDKLVEFMEMYDLPNLELASAEQLQEYINRKGMEQDNEGSSENKVSKKTKRKMR